MVGEVHDLEVALVSYHVVNHAFHDGAVGGCKLELGVMQVHVEQLVAYDVLNDLDVLGELLGLNVGEDDLVLLLAI